MANRINHTWFLALASVVMVATHLRSQVEAQQASQASESPRSESSFGTPPSFEKVPQRVGSRSPNTSTYPSTSQNTDTSQYLGTSPNTAVSDQEWLPKTSRAAQSSPANSQASRNSEVQQASFTTQPVATIAPVGPSTSSAAATLPRSDRSIIPLKPPSKDAKDLVPSKSRTTWSSAISMVVSLLLVIGIFLGLSWIFRKTSPSAGSILPKEVVEIVGRTPMANRQQLYVIRFGRKLVLVSQQVGQTEVLSEIDDRTEVDHLLGLCEQTTSRNVASSFRNVLQQVATSTDSKWSLRQRRDATRPVVRDTSASIDTLS